MATTVIEKAGKNAMKAAEDPKRLAIAGAALAAVPLAAQGLSKLRPKRIAGKVSELGDEAKSKADQIRMIA